MSQPAKPACPNFSSGPCAKRPGFSPAEAYKDAPFGRSHRAPVGMAKIRESMALTKEILKIPKDYLVAMVPASDTGAVEMMMWQLLGPRGVTVCHWESFGSGWMTDAEKQLKLPKLRSLKGEYGQLPDLGSIDWNDDVVFTYNGTTSGVRVPNTNWIPDNRAGLTICDATSAAFAMDIDWSKIDVLTYSWQKCLGGEGAHGMLVISPRTVERLESFKSNRPMPKIFRLTKNGKLDKSIFNGSVINTPSMTCFEDYLDALKWAKGVGGLDGLIKRSMRNLEVIQKFCASHPWMSFLAKDPATISNTSVCLTISDLDKGQVKTLIALLERNKVAYDIGAYRDAPAGLRIWCGPTVETKDVVALMEWIDYAHDKVKAGTIKKMKIIVTDGELRERACACCSCVVCRGLLRLSSSSSAAITCEMRSCCRCCRTAAVSCCCVCSMQRCAHGMPAAQQHLRTQPHHTPHLFTLSFSSLLAPSLHSLSTLPPPRCTPLTSSSSSGLAPAAIKMLQNAGHEVVKKKLSKEELLAGALAEWDAIVIRSATKINAA
eukprot:2988432-Rhodomonas_salina.1